MPTIPCPDCQKPVSPDAAACPACGSPVAKKTGAGGPTGLQFAADVTTGCFGCLGALLAIATALTAVARALS